MRFTLRKLRVAVVVGAGLLVAVVAGFVWYGQHSARQWFSGLPKQLGVDIKQEANGFTYSQSLKGKTVFTVHASKEVQRSNGVITLHDAGIVLYGRQDGKADRIHGNQFEFDQPHGLMTAVGDVYIDLAAPAGKSGTASADDDSQLIHVKTSGLIFDQKKREATTNEEIEFAAAGLKGTAVGADYDSANGMVVLRSAVHVNGMRNGRPLDLVASHAVLDRAANTAVLTDARYVSGAGQKGGESSAADHAVVHLGPDSQPEKLEADGHVVLGGAGRGSLSGSRLEVGLSAAGQPRDAHLWGGVNYREVTASKDAKGSAQDLRVAFDGKGQPTHAVIAGQVSMDERVESGIRSLTGAKVELSLVGAVKGRVEVRDAVATGRAQLRTVSSGAKGRTTTELSGDTLNARFTTDGTTERVSGLSGAGHTVVRQVAGNGVEETSSGETLEVSFKDRGEAGATEKQRAVQRGAVQIVRTTPGQMRGGKAAVITGKASGIAAPTVQHAEANQAVYEGDTDLLTLSGGVQVSDETSVLLADTVAMERASGDSTAEGNVRVSYVAADGKGEPVHVTSARAVERHGAGTAEFIGVAGRDARMWQGMSQLEAPVLRLEEAKDAPIKRRLVAHGDVSGDADFVRAVLVSERPGGAKPSRSDGGVVKIVAHEMVYTEAQGTVTFKGRVRVEDRSGMIHAREATAFLATEPNARRDRAAGGFPAGRVDRMVAAGSVQVEQPGRQATGELLVYTASDQTYVMIGGKDTPPKVVDNEKGTITGATLRFRSGDKSVMVAGGDAASGAQRIRGETRVRQ